MRSNLRKLDTYLIVKRHHACSSHGREAAVRGWRRTVLVLGIVLVLMMGATLLLVGTAYAWVTADLPSLQKVPALLEPPNGLFLQPTRLYDRSGQHLLLTLENPGTQRRYLPLDESRPVHLSPQLVRVTVAALEPDFWSNPGFRLDRSQTLAERLAANLLLENEAPGWRRDFRERLLAAQLTASFGRNKVLEWYLNSAYYGHLAYGADAAAQVYLGHSAAQLDLAEAVLLTAVSQAPSLNPLDAPIAAREGAQMLLARLLTQGALSVEEYTSAAQELAGMQFNKEPQAPVNLAPAFTRLALAQVAAQYGRQRVERGGLKVITTLDYDLQMQTVCTLMTQLLRAANDESEIKAPDGSECSAADRLPPLPPGVPPPSPMLAASAEVLDPLSGQILALVGETHADRGESAGGEFFAGHPPGSLLTPFVYLTGFARGMSPASLVWDVPASLPASLTGQTNPDGKFHGPVRVRIAMDNDYLASAAETLAQYGPSSVWQLAGQLGLSSLDNDSEKMIYGGGEVHLVEAAQAYGVFAAGGMLAGEETTSHRLVSATVLRVESLDGADSSDQSLPQQQTVLSGPLAYLVNNILSDETARWPSLGHPNMLEVGRPTGVKLGQTADRQDAWTIGYTPQRLVAVWFGDPTGQVDWRVPAGLWHAVIQYASRDLPAEGWSAPPGVTTVAVCDPSGLLPTQDCPNVVDEIFLQGNEPTHPDTLYRSYQINRETGRLATVFTPPELVDTRVYMSVPPEAQDWAREAGIPAPPRDYDAIQVPPPSPDAHITTPDLFAVVSGKVNITGTAAGKNFGYYRIQVGQGLNPRAWEQVGPDGNKPVTEGLLASWDTTSLDGLYAVRLLVVSRDQQVEMATIQVTVDNTPPMVKIVEPSSSEKLAFSSGRPPVFQIMANDNIGVARVEYYLDGRLTATLGDAPYNYPWTGATQGKHSLTVKVFDRAGNQTDAGPVEFTVGP